MLSAMAPHGREMSQDLRKKIISLHKKDEGYKKISKALLISQNTVAQAVQTFKKDGTATISQRRPGRPRKLTPRQERLLMRRVEENRHASSLQLSKEVESQTGVTISRDTIRRTLQRNGMHGYRPRKKPLLKPRHKKAHLEFARAHADKDEDYWALYSGVKVIQWPSMSPDLNPIEHLWGILKRQVEHHSPCSIRSLKEVILEEWKKIDLAKCRQLVHFMPRRRCCH